MSRRSSRYHNTYAIGDYRSEGYSRWDKTIVKPAHRETIVKIKTGEKEHTDPLFPNWRGVESIEQHLNDQEIMDAVMTVKNSSIYARREQANVLAYYGYHGPVSGGEARLLKRLFAELGYNDLVKRGWSTREVTVTVRPGRYMIRRYARMGQTAPMQQVRTVKLQYCYQFKSPMDGVHFSKFIKLCRMYKGDKVGLYQATKAVLDNPEAHKEIETIDTLDILAGLPGMD